MYIDHERADIVFTALREAFVAKSFPYDQSLTPQQIVGEELSKFDKLTQSRYWFYLCMYMRGPVDSNYAAKKTS